MPDTLIKVDLTQSAYENDMIHNRWHPDVPMVAWVSPGDDFIVETYDWTGGFIKNNDSAAAVLLGEETVEAPQALLHRTATLSPYTTLFRSDVPMVAWVSPGDYFIVETNDCGGGFLTD